MLSLKTNQNYTLMKKLILILSVLSIVLFSCKKSNTQSSVTSTLSLLQHKWLIDSIVLYQNVNFTGNRFVGYTGNNTQYFDFRATGKLYSFAGVPTPTFDTSDYVLLPDNYTMLVNKYVNGIRSNRTDTATVRSVTTTNLVIGNTKNAANEYGKFSFHR